jgi:hypothetical protein
MPDIVSGRPFPLLFYLRLSTLSLEPREFLPWGMGAHGCISAVAPTVVHNLVHPIALKQAICKSDLMAQRSVLDETGCDAQSR